MNIFIKNEAPLNKLTEKEKEIFELIMENPKLSSREIGVKFSITTAAVNHILRSLKQKGYVRKSEIEEKDEWIILK